MNSRCIQCNKIATYKCKTCTSIYCSIYCYRLHNDSKCSELFYMNECNTRLSNTNATKDVKTYTSTMLTNLYKDRLADIDDVDRHVDDRDRHVDDVDEQDSNKQVDNSKYLLDIQEASKLIDSIDSISVDTLTYKQQQLFSKYIHTHVDIDLVIPWYVSDNVHTLSIIEVSKDDVWIDIDDSKQVYTSRQQQISKILHIRDDMYKHIHSIGKVHTSKYILYSICNIVSIYVYVYYTNLSDVCISTILSMCKCIHNNYRQVYTSIHDSIDSKYMYIDDILQIYSNKVYICEILYTIYLLLNTCSKYKSIQHKMNYYMSVVRDIDNSIYNEVVKELHMYKSIVNN